MKRVCSKLMCIILISMLLVANVSAAFIGTADPSMDLKYAEYLTHAEVELIAKQQIDGYISTEIDTTKRIIVPSSNYIDLHDSDGNIFAYIVPLIERGIGEIGHIVVGAIRDGFSTYEIVLENSLLNNYRAALNDGFRISKSSGEEVFFDVSAGAYKTSLVFLPPMTYLVKVETEKSTAYYDISSGTLLVNDVTEAISKSANSIADIYSTIRSEKHEARINSLLTSTSNTQNTKSSVTDVRIGDEWVSDTAFIPVVYQQVTHYGGDQNWYSTTAKRENGCGPVAAANIVYYLATHNSNLSELYAFSEYNLTWSLFLNHMNTMYDHIDPSAIGEFSLAGLANDVVNYANECLTNGCSLSAVTMSAATGYALEIQKERCVNTIIAGLSSDCPVAALNLALPTSDYAYAWHWVTITKYFSNSTNSWIAISTWGERRSIDFDAYFEYAYPVGGGFAYFTYTT